MLALNLELTQEKKESNDQERGMSNIDLITDEILSWKWKLTADDMFEADFRLLTAVSP